MSLQDISDVQLITDSEVLRRIKKALTYKLPFSLVRVGDGENIVLGQYTFLSESEFVNSYWMKASRGDRAKGVKLPNIKLRNQMIEAIKKADLVGICRQNNDEMMAPEEFKRPLTNKIFDYYQIQPKNLCHVFINRRMASYELFWRMISKYQVLLISRWAKAFAAEITKKYQHLKPNITGCIEFSDYSQIPSVLNQVKNFHYDLVLISAGVNAVVLAPYIALLYGKVAIDFGKTMMFTVKKSRLIKPWKG